LEVLCGLCVKLLQLPHTALLQLRGSRLHVLNLLEGLARRIVLVCSVPEAPKAIAVNILSTEYCGCCKWGGGGREGHTGKHSMQARGRGLEAAAGMVVMLHMVCQGHV
jgi:hypothetical protein